MRTIARNSQSNREREKHLVEIKKEYTTIETPKVEVHRGKPGNIDIQAVMKKFSTFPKEKLSLKYQDFVNGNFKAGMDLKKEETNDKYITHSKDRITRDESTNNNIQNERHYLEHDKETEPNLNDDSREQHSKMSERLTKHQIIQHDDPDSKEHKSMKQYENAEEVSPPEKFVKQPKKENSEMIEYELEMPQSSEKEAASKISSDNVPKEDLSRIFRAMENNASVPEIKAKEEKDLTESETSKENQVSGENNEDTAQVEVYETKELHDDNSTFTNIKVRREGDKLFAFDPSPEYSEYHDQLAKQHSQKNGTKAPT